MSEDEMSLSNHYRLSAGSAVSDENRLRELIESATNVPCTSESVRGLSRNQGGWAAILVGIPWMVISSVVIELMLKRYGSFSPLMYFLLWRGGPVCIAIVLGWLVFRAVAKRSRHDMESVLAHPSELVGKYYSDEMEVLQVGPLMKQVVARASNKGEGSWVGVDQEGVQARCKTLEKRLQEHLIYVSRLIAHLQNVLSSWSVEAERPRILGESQAIIAELDERIAALTELTPQVALCAQHAHLPLLDSMVDALEEQLSLLPELPRYRLESLPAQVTQVTDADEDSDLVTMRKGSQAG